MSSVVLSGNTSGSITLSAPDVSGSNTITLPASTGTVLTTGSPQSGGVIQVVTASSTTGTSTSSATFVTTGFSASITPKFSNSKIIIQILGAFSSTGSANGQSVFTIYRNSTNIGNGNSGLAYCFNATSLQTSPNIGTSDLPATTSSTTYTLYVRNAYSGTVDWNGNNVLSTMMLMEVAA